MKRILANALFGCALVAPAALVLSSDGFAPAVGESLILAAPAGGQLLHPAVDVGAKEYPLPLLPADGTPLVHAGLFEAESATVLLPAVILERDVARGVECAPGLLRVAAVDTDAGRFGLVLAPEDSPLALGAELRTAHNRQTPVEGAGQAGRCPSVPSI